MQFFSAKSLLYLRVVFLSVITFYSFKDASAIANAGFTLLLGQAMRLPLVIVEADNPVYGTVGLVFGSLVLGEVVPLVTDNVEYFDDVVPMRLLAYFLLALYSVLGSSAFLCNNLVFTYAFFEIWFNFLIFNNLRDERFTRMKKVVQEAQDKGEIDLQGMDQDAVNELTKELLKQLRSGQT